MSISNWENSRPDPSEYGEYYEGYIDLVDSENVIEVLIKQGQETYALMRQLTADEADHQYAEGKWNVREVIGHLIDTERIMAYRALCISRGEAKSLPGYDQDAYVENADFGERSIQNLSTEYDAQRNANISLFSSFSGEQILRTGTANEVTVSVRALAYIIAGHERHHLNILDDRYGVQIPGSHTEH